MFDWVQKMPQKCLHYSCNSGFVFPSHKPHERDEQIL